MFSLLRAKQAGAPLWSLVFYQFCARTLWALSWIFFGLRALHQERVPRQGGLILAANHQSYLDPPSIGSLICGRRHLDFIARVGLFTFKPFGWVITALNSIPIRGDGNDASSIKEILRRLEQGRAILIFPEGARTEDGEMHDFKRGAALLVKRAKCPVQPVAIDGAYDVWPPHRGVPRLFRRKVRVIYGVPIAPDELMKDGPDAAMQRLHDEVAKLLVELRNTP
jgi:1-acyl-sn-glycerol-3-phosphate acyltransferase